MKKGSWLCLGGLLLVAAVLLLLASPSETGDPTASQRRSLQVTVARVSPGGDQLEVRGTTNLVDGSKLQLLLRSGAEEVAQRETTVQGRGFSFVEKAQGRFSPGRYVVEVRFELASQTQDVAKQLSFQPRTLSDRAEVDFQASLANPASGGRGNAVLELINRVSQAQPDELAALDREAARLDATLWISSEKAALRSLRQAIAEGSKSRPDRQAFERLLLKAHTQVGRGS